MTFSIDLIRAIAIMMVILVHSSFFPYRIPGEITNGVVSNWFTANIFAAIGYLGVPIFVMLNGALLLNPEKSDEPMRVFFKKRFYRIGLPLIFWTFIFFVWSFYVHGTPATLSNVGKGLISGAYPTLWFLYLLVGLYLITPILRILVKNLDHSKFTLLIGIWFLGTISVPIIHTFTSFSYDPLLFVITDWVGFYLLGIYLVNIKIRPALTYIFLILGLAVAVGGAWFITASMGEEFTGFFHGYLSFNMIIASAALFLILIGIPQNRFFSIKNHVFNRIIRWVGQNTLPIYLVHIIVLESLQLGFFGFMPYTYNLLIDVPLLTLLTVLLSVAVVYPLKKIPYLTRLIG